jgi:hypothetical protein
MAVVVSRALYAGSNLEVRRESQWRDTRAQLIYEDWVSQDWPRTRIASAVHCEPVRDVSLKR